MTSDPFSDTGYPRDLFEVDNAKALYPGELASTFVATRDYWRLLSAKNHIVLGSRGSGKTALIKMLAHEYLSRYEHSRARSAVRDASFIGIYVPMSLDWVGALRNKPWLEEGEGEEMFQWRLNVAGCAAFLVTLESCLRVYRPRVGQRARSEYSIVRELSSLWGSDIDAVDIRGLRRYLRAIVSSRGREARISHVAGRRYVPADRSSFDEELFAPIRWAADVTGEELGFPPRTSWLIGIDETELLKPFQQRILNTAIRSASGQFFYKLTTLPYGHYTLSTNAERELEVGHDFEYVRIDRDPIHDSERALTGVFVKSVYSRRQRLSTERYPHASLHELFGDSRILLPGRGVWPTYEAFAAELDHHLLPAAATRAHDILGRSKTAFANQVGRRLRGTIELRLALQSRPGHQTPDIYAGSQMFVRCADGNPRRIIRLFKAMLERSPIRDNREVKNGRPLVPPNAQTEVMIAFSAESLLRARAEEQIGFEVFDLVNAIGRFANASTYADRIGTDAVTTVRVDSRVSDRTWAAVMRACDLGLLYANVGWNNPDQWPIRSGYFHLAYVLAPHFRVLPRRGRSRSLALVLRDAPTLEGQLRLFREASDE